MENMLTKIKDLEAQVKALTEALLMTQEKLRQQEGIVAYLLNKEVDDGDE